MSNVFRSLNLFGVLSLAGLSCGVLALAEDTPKKEAPQKDSATAKTEAVKESPKKEGAPADKKWQPLFDGKTLTGWKVTEFGSGGEIEVEGDHILIGYGDGCTGLTWTKDFPKVDYEVLVEAQRVDGTDFFCGLTFPVQESPCSLIVGGWGGALVGLSSIDGEDAAHNDTKQYLTFEKKKWYQIRLRVTKTHISAWIDDKRVILQGTTGHKLSIRPEVQKSLPFGICSWCTTAAVRKADVRKLTPEETKPEVEPAKDADKPTDKATDK
ncbi:MAG: signal peptide protein [Planctomycetaceae bacterium]|nr:signal peptide protein [Planctomycetaceae bacterium]